MKKWVVRWHDDWNGGPHYWSPVFSNERDALTYALNVYESINGWLDVEVYTWDGETWVGAKSNKLKERKQIPYEIILFVTTILVVIIILMI